MRSRANRRRPRWSTALLTLLLLATACTSDVAENAVGAPETSAAPSPEPAAPTRQPAAIPSPTPPSPTPPAPTPPPSVTPTPPPSPAPATAPTPLTNDLRGEDGLPLGAYVVARPWAGTLVAGAAAALPEGPTTALPVYDEPGGQRRQLVEINAIDGVELPLPLFGWEAHGSPTVLRVIEGAPGDDWFRVQAPTRPHNTSVWVSANDFEWASTTRRIEIDLAGPGQLTVYDGDQVLMTSGIVQGRDTRPTPEHVTFLEAGVAGEFAPSPAYGQAILTMASYSERLGTFGGGGSPRNFLHGTNQPELMGQRVSSGEIRLPNASITQLIDLVHPGTPVLVFTGDGGRERILAVDLVPSRTVEFARDVVGSNATERTHPQLWRRCEEPQLVCENTAPAVSQLFRYAVAADPDSELEIPAFDRPNGTQGSAIDHNAVDGTRLAYPLYPTTTFGQPLALRVLHAMPNTEWLLVQVPVRPNGSTVWVRGADFVVHETTKRVEITTAPWQNSDGGRLLVLDGDEVLVDVPIASGRETRPTALGTGWVGQILDGPSLGPTYGVAVIDIALTSESLGTFGGGGIPRHAIRGTNQPETVGHRVTSGSARLRNEDLEAILAIDGILGAPVRIRDVPLTDELLAEPVPMSASVELGEWVPDAPAPVTSFA